MIFKRLTLFSKILFFTVICCLIFAFIIFCLSFFIIGDNDLLLNKNTGEVLTREGIYLRLPWMYGKINNDVQCNEILAIVQDNSRNIYYTKISIYSNYNLDWIKKNKRIPKSIKIQNDIIASYLNNNYSNYSIQELEANNRKLQFNIINNFLNENIKNKSNNIINILIPYPLIKLN
jgi:hypothetical protein